MKVLDGDGGRGVHRSVFVEGLSGGGRHDDSNSDDKVSKVLAFVSLESVSLDERSQDSQDLDFIDGF